MEMMINFSKMESHYMKLFVDMKILLSDLSLSVLHLSGINSVNFSFPHVIASFYLCVYVCVGLSFSSALPTSQELVQIVSCPIKLLKWYVTSLLLLTYLLLLLLLPLSLLIVYTAIR